MPLRFMAATRQGGHAVVAERVEVVAAVAAGEAVVAVDAVEEAVVVVAAAVRAVVRVREQGPHHFWLPPPAATTRSKAPAPTPTDGRPDTSHGGHRPMTCLAVGGRRG